VKRLLTAYFIGNISAKKCENPFMCARVVASQRWNVFLRHGVFIAVQHKAGINMVIAPCRFFEIIHDFDFGVARVH